MSLIRLQITTKMPKKIFSTMRFEPSGVDSDTDMLLEMGKFQVEVHCLNAPEELPAQSLTLSARRLKPILQRLEQNGIEVSPVEQDPYTGLRCIRFDGPDGVQITIIEA